MKGKKYKIHGKRVLTCLLSALLLSGCLAGCSSDVSDGSSEASSGLRTGTVPQESAAPAPPDRPSEPEYPKELYNGIMIDESLYHSVVMEYNANTGKVPYLKEISEGGTHPETVNITVGRQLFVDDFLIDRTDLKTTFHKADIYEDNPIVVGEGGTEGERCVLSGGGVWYDEDEKLFKMFYQANWAKGVALATSKDGIHWEKPPVGFGSNIVYSTTNTDSTTVWYNPDAEDPDRKYILFVRPPDSAFGAEGGTDNPAQIFTSPDGIDWTFCCSTGPVGDRTTVFFNPFTNEWCMSIRSLIPCSLKKPPSIRARSFFHAKDLKDFANCAKEKVPWVVSDEFDQKTEYVNVAEVYNVDCVAYESIMLSVVELFEGPENALSNRLGIPKRTELTLAFSRDGFSIDRSNKQIFVGASGEAGTWNQGYLSPACGCCVTVGDKLYFYYSGFCNTGVYGAYGKAGIGLATLRRDGFASLDGSGTVLTRKMKLDEDRKFLFVNAKTAENGSIRAEILDRDGNVIPGYSLNDCKAFSGDSTCTALSFGEGKDLSFLRDQDFRIRFELKDGEFYSFWLSDEEGGESHGYHGAGLVE